MIQDFTSMKSKFGIEYFKENLHLFSHSYLVRNLMRGMLDRNVRQRLKLADVETHDWIVQGPPPASSSSEEETSEDSSELLNSEN